MIRAPSSLDASTAKSVVETPPSVLAGVSFGRKKAPETRSNTQEHAIAGARRGQLAKRETVLADTIEGESPWELTTGEET